MCIDVVLVVLPTLLHIYPLFTLSLLYRIAVRCLCFILQKRAVVLFWGLRSWLNPVDCIFARSAASLVVKSLVMVSLRPLFCEDSDAIQQIVRKLLAVEIHHISESCGNARYKRAIAL